MRNTGRAIDHFVVSVPDLDRAASAFEALGFTLTPRAQHPWGTANRLALLPGGNFFELLEVDRPELVTPHGSPMRARRARQGNQEVALLGEGFSFGAFNTDFLAGGAGPSMLVLQTEDADGDRARYAAAGLKTYPRFDFERQGKLPDGSSATLAFSLAFTSDAALPACGFFTCHNRAPDLFWKPDYMRHRNGAQAIEAVMLAAEQPAAHGAFLAGFSGGGVETTADGIAVGAGAHRIEVLTPAAAGRLGLTPDLSRGPRFIGARVAAAAPPAPRTAPDPAHGLLIDWRTAG
jgi:hypothetical protein